VNKAIGDWGEFHAISHLVEKSYSILDRNYRIRSGELDIVASLFDLVVFVEVKSSTLTNSLYDLEERVTTVKRRRCELAAQHWLQQNSKEGPCRFDVILVEGEPSKPKLHHFEDAWLEGE
jgi:putative endonuclease